MKLYGKCRLVYSWILITVFLIPIISCGGNVSTDSAATGTAPSTPIEVSATAMGSMVTIGWESVSGATSYSVYWGTSSGVTTSSETKITGISFAVYTHTGLTNDTTYYYVVTANNSAGESPASSEVSATPEAVTAAAGTGTVLGVAKDTDGNVLDGVTVEIFVDGTFTVSGPSPKPSADGASPRNAALVTTTTGSDGSYTLSGIEVANNYEITYTKSAYVIVYMYDVDVTGNTILYMETVTMVDESSSPGDADGTITNALSGDPESGVTVKFYSNMNNTSGTVQGTTTTDSLGAYSITGLDAGNYTAQISKTDFATSTFSIYIVGESTTSDQNGAIMPGLSSGQTRIILTWGETPYDLDSHLRGPYGDESESEFHIYWVSKTYTYASITYADLDLDDVSSYGPETTTIYNQSTGTYTFCVYDFTNGFSSSSTALANSGAQVNVYQESSLIATYNVPNSGGTEWKVFTLSGTTITPSNEMSYETSDSQVCADEG